MGQRTLSIHDATSWLLETTDEVEALGHELPAYVSTSGDRRHWRRLRLFGRHAIGEPALPLAEVWLEGAIPQILQAYLSALAAGQDLVITSARRMGKIRSVDILQALQKNAVEGGEPPAIPYPGAF